MEKKHLKAIAIIPARGGSIRLPHKNIKLFCGEPIIKYSIETALNAKIFDEVMVSTEDKQIAKMAKKYGASVPFMRSKETASNKANISEVLLEVLKNYRAIGIEFDYICCIYATAPLTENKRILQGYKMVQGKFVDSVVPVVSFDYPIQRALTIKDDHVKMIDNKFINTQSQHLPLAYHDAGKFYFAKTKQFMKYKTFFMPNARPIILPKTMAQDIDDKDDFVIAEIKYSIKHQKFDWLIKEKHRRWYRKQRWVVWFLALLSSALITGSII